MFTMLPRRWATITSPASLDRCQMAVTFTSTALRKTSSVSSSMLTVWPMPALLTSTSIVPCCSTTSRMSRSRSSVSDTSHTIAVVPGSSLAERVEPLLASRRDDHRRAGGVQHAREPIAETR